MKIIPVERNNLKVAEWLERFLKQTHSALKLKYEFQSQGLIQTSENEKYKYVLKPSQLKFSVKSGCKNKRGPKVKSNQSIYTIARIMPLIALFSPHLELNRASLACSITRYTDYWKFRIMQMQIA